MRAIQELEKAGYVTPSKRIGARSSYIINQCHGVTGDNVSRVTTEQKPVTNESQTSDNLTKTSDMVSPEEKKRENRIEKENKPPAFIEEAKRLLEGMTADSKPSFSDQDNLEKAAAGSVSAWRSFRNSADGKTKKFLEKIA